METQSFIDSTITAMSEKSNKFALIARTIQAQDHAEVANRIALAYIRLNNDRKDAKRANTEPPVKPEQLFSFVQALMNQCCWAARRVAFAQLEQEAEDQANGVDFSEAIADEAGVSGIRTEDLGKLIDDDFFVLGNVQSWLAGRMNYLTEIEQLYLFADHKMDDTEQWVLEDSADSFEQALALMDTLLAAMQEEEAVATSEEAQTIDFGLKKAA
jgi:hypothetical protein